MPEDEKYYSFNYEELPQEKKDIADAILSFLSGMNTQEAKDLIIVIDYELAYRSTVS